MILYLAAPYSHQDPAIREARVLAADKAAAKLMTEGAYRVFAPQSFSPDLEVLRSRSDRPRLLASAGLGMAQALRLFGDFDRGRVAGKQGDNDGD
jgi:hypothetical protein